jgi:hypothetical protein
MRMEILTADRFVELTGTELEPILPMLAADDVRVITVRDDAGELVGHWAAIRYVHMEAIHIAPAHRKRGRVLAKLLEGMRTIAAGWNTGAVLTGSMCEDVSSLILHYGGVELPGTHYVLPVERVRCRP